MGACATKSGDLKVDGEAPLVVEDVLEKKVAVVVEATAEDVTCRKSLSELLKEVAAESDGDAPMADKNAVVVLATATTITATNDETVATEEQLPAATASPSVATTKQEDTTEIEREPAATHQEQIEDPDDGALAKQAPAHEEKRVAADAESAEEKKQVADASEETTGSE